MKYTAFFSIGFFLVATFLGGLILWYTHVSHVQKLRTDSFTILSETLIKKSNAIEERLASIERTIETLAASPEVKTILRKQKVFNNSLIVKDVDRRTQVITREIENYLVAYPQLTLKELQESSVFQSIALQLVGKEGYSVLLDYKKQVVVMHIYEKFIGLNLSSDIIRDTLPEIYNLHIESKEKKNVSGFYDWKDPDGEIRRKYVHFSHIDTQTGDDVVLAVEVSAYVDDYKIIHGLSISEKEYIDTIKDDFGYSNIVFISPEGQVVYAVEESSLLGSNLTWLTNIEDGLTRNYIRVAGENQLSFYGPYIGTYGDIYPNFSIMSPVFVDGSDELLGFVAIIEAMDDMFDIAVERFMLSDTQETYLVNEDQLLISPVLLRDLNMFVQSVVSENVEHCFETDYDKIYLPDVLINYRGNKILGVSKFLPNVGWCIVTEISFEEAVSLPAKEHTQDKAVPFIFIIITLTIIGFGTGWFIDRHKKKK